MKKMTQVCGREKHNKRQHLHAANVFIKRTNPSSNSVYYYLRTLKNDNVHKD